jgi:superkiller protein 3
MVALAGNPTSDDFTRALSDFEQAVAIAPNEPSVRFNVGTALYKLQRYDEALVHLRVAVSVDPGNADAWGNIGAAFQQSGRFAEALDPYQRALKLKPDLEWVRYNISAVQLQLGRTDEAAAAIAGATTTQASMPHRVLLAEAFLTQGQFKRAIDEYQLALSAGPLPADALNHLGYALLQERRPAEAEQFLRLSVAAQTNNAAAYSNLGNALQQLGRLEESFIVYRLALAAPGGAQQPETHNDFGVALARAGRMDEAIVQFREAVRLDPSYGAARDNLTRALRTKTGN